MLHQALQGVFDIFNAFPNSELSRIEWIRGFREALNFIIHGAENLQVCTAAMEKKGSGGVAAQIIQELTHD